MLEGNIMSSNPNSETGSGSRPFDSAEAEAVRKSFASLSLEKKLSTLLRIELDLVGDIAEVVVATANRVVDEVGRAFSGSKPPASTASTSSTSTQPGPGSSVPPSM